MRCLSCAPPKSWSEHIGKTHRCANPACGQKPFDEFLVFEKTKIVAQQKTKMRHGAWCGRCARPWCSSEGCTARSSEPVHHDHDPENCKCRGCIDAGKQAKIDAVKLRPCRGKCKMMKEHTKFGQYAGGSYKASCLECEEKLDKTRNVCGSCGVRADRRSRSDKQTNEQRYCSD